MSRINGTTVSAGRDRQAAVNGRDRRAVMASSVQVGTDADGYTSPNNAWMIADGTNPPTVATMRFQDQTTGGLRTVTVAGGAWVIA